MKYSTAFPSISLALVSIAHGSPTPAVQDYPSDSYEHPANGICTDYKISSTVTSLNNVYGGPKFQNNYDVAASLFNISQLFRQTPEDGAIGFIPFSSAENSTATYELAGTFCRPKEEKSGKEKTVLIATHGLGYDRRYWASSYQPEKYSFVQAMLDDGYSVLYYDRLGTGKSQKISGYVNQQSIQTKLLRQLVADVRSGKYTDTVKAEKIALVGHSFGSTISAAAIAEAPDLADALVLTGYSVASPDDNLSPRYQLAIPSIFASRIATPKYPDLDSGYLMFGDIYAHVESFFHQPDYTIPTAEYAQSISQPSATTEFLTVTLASPGRSAEFKGKLWIGTGQYDLIVCSGNCDVTFKTGAYKDMYSGVKDPKGYVLPGAGHGMNFHLNSPDAFADIAKLLDGGL